MIELQAVDSPMNAYMVKSQLDIDYFKLCARI